MSAMDVRISKLPFVAEDELKAFVGSRPLAGACVSFVGLCRGEGAAGSIAWLELEHYPGFTESEISRVANEITASLDLLDLLVIHRVGRVFPGEPIVLAAAISAHRASAFAAVEQLMDYLKTDAPFWKREMRDDGAYWIEPTPEDRRRRARHNGDRS